MGTQEPLFHPAQHPRSGLIASEILGSISMAAFLCLSVPQLMTNYKLKSADSLSMAFLLVWLVGDLANLLGGAMNHIAPASILVSAYLCLSDSTLICQSLYYNLVNPNRAGSRDYAAGLSPNAEEQPLLASCPQSASESSALPAQRPGNILPKRSGVSGIDGWRYNLACIAIVATGGVLGWIVLYNAGVLGVDQATSNATSDDSRNAESLGFLLGYFGALCYLCARIPQILKNHRGRSCEGLSTLFLLLSITGNLTYGLSVIAYKREKDYLLTSVPWLLGSLGTILEDFVILIQIRVYTTEALKIEGIVP
ncbi:7 transmembrane domain-containing protein [Colletotrichum plurivorum]|uniref:7 transmembrane domain-containing protein n=1 Tax=Colletotrichum plurivorum TaxID=2175906 RepID=A0A8H6N0Y3_9PEZI|nr:7 transmembrane domain-containing protein [Colletotrichum plurivorum]